MSDSKTIKNYAISLFNSIQTSQQKQNAFENISLFNEIMLSSSSVYWVFCSPTISNFDKSKLIKIFAEKYKFDKVVIQFLLVILKNARFKIFSAVVEEYKELLRHSQGIKNVIIEAANKLSEKELSAIKKYLENKLQKLVEINIVENKSLIGGILIKYDNLLYDYSVIGAINKISHLAKNAKI